MAKWHVVALTIGLALPSGALAQAPELQAQAQHQGTADLPEGYPYNVGQAYESTQVPLRDYLSSRIDQLRNEMLDRMERDRIQNLQLLDERDRQYSQRFEAQQKATADSLQAAKDTSAKELQATKETSANALSAAKEAVIKAEDATNKRFESVNEFRKSLDDLSRIQMPRAEAEALFGALAEKVAGLSRAADAARDQGTGRDDTWSWIIALIAIIIAGGSFAMNYNRQKAAA